MDVGRGFWTGCQRKPGSVLVSRRKLEIAAEQKGPGCIHASFYRRSANTLVKEEASGTY